MTERNSKSNTLRQRLYVIIFGTDTPAGKAFDLILIISIIMSVAVVMFDSVASVNARHGRLLGSLEWLFTALFTIEYMLRIFCSPKPMRYVSSFFGLIDLLAILPTYLGLLIPGGMALATVRVLRVLRVFRVLKLAIYVREANYLLTALIASRRKIFVFFFAVITLVITLGSLMYVIEHGHNSGFDNIPRSVYWAIVTLTTVGYGDISPITPLGQFVSSVIMILGYSIIAVPTGIITAQIASASGTKYQDKPDTNNNTQATPTQCPHCGHKL